MANGNYIRVGGRQYPTCPICGHDSWCSVQPPGYVNVRTGEVDEFGSVICMRQSSVSADPSYRIARSISHSKGLGGLAFKWVPVASDAKMSEGERQKLRDAAAKHAAKRAGELARQVANQETVAGMIWGKAKDYTRPATLPPSQSNGLVRIADYFTARGVPMKPEQVPLSLAFYPDVQDGYERVWPAMVAKVVTPRDAHNARNDALKLPRVQHERPEAFLGVHITYLSRDGQPKKRPAEQGVARKKRGQVGGGAIRLYEDVLEHERAKARGGDMIWLIGEGIETTIAARAALATVGTQVDAWSVMDAGGLASVQLPDQLFGPVLVSNDVIAVARVKRHEESNAKRERLEAAGVAGASTLADCDIGPLWPHVDLSKLEPRAAEWCKSGGPKSMAGSTIIIAADLDANGVGRAAAYHAAEVILAQRPWLTVIVAEITRELRNDWAKLDAFGRVSLAPPATNATAAEVKGYDYLDAFALCGATVTGTHLQRAIAAAGGCDEAKQRRERFLAYDGTAHALHRCCPMATSGAIVQMVVTWSVVEMRLKALDGAAQPAEAATAPAAAGDGGSKPPKKRKVASGDEDDDGREGTYDGGTPLRSGWLYFTDDKARLIIHDSPVSRARAFLDICMSPPVERRAGSGFYLRCTRDGWYLWRGGRYFKVTKETVEAQVRNFLVETYETKWDKEKEKFVPHRLKFGQRLIQEVMHALESDCMVLRESFPQVLAPSFDKDGKAMWGAASDLQLLDGKPYEPPSLISFRNGLLDIDAYCRGEVVMSDHTPLWFSLSRLDFDFPVEEYEQHAGTDDQLHTWINERTPELQAWGKQIASDDAWWLRFQEVMGLLLDPKIILHGFPVFTGPPRSGKGTTLKVLQLLVGENNYVASSFQDLADDRFHIKQWMGKQVAFMSDAQMGTFTDPAVVGEWLKKLSAGDAITVRLMHRQDGPTLVLNTKIVIFANERPKLRDASNALSSRMWFMPMTVSFKGREDPKLFSRIEREIVGIMLWALEGLKRVRTRIDQGKRPLTDCELATQEAAAYDRDTSTVKGFVEDCCEIVDDKRVRISTGRLYSMYLAWCEQQAAIERTLTTQQFGSQLHTAFPVVDTIGPIASDMLDDKGVIRLTNDGKPVRKKVRFYTRIKPVEDHGLEWKPEIAGPVDCTSREPADAAAQQDDGRIAWDEAGNGGKA